MNPRLRWMLYRLRSMPPAELPHRALEQLYRRIDRSGGLARAATALPEALLASPPPSWPVDLERLSRIGGAARARIEADAAAILGGGFTMLGRRWRSDQRTEWALDPESGERWPEDVYTFDVDFRHGNAGRDVKIAWELNRLQHLQLLAAAAALGDAGARSVCLDDLERWIRDNPPYQGIAWASGIELASRALSILAIVGLLGAASIEAPLRGAIWRCLSAHGAWLHRYPSLYSSANNHRVAELGGLWALGHLAPELPGADRWRAVGQEIAQEARRQIYPDGVGGEQTPTYQAYSMEWFAACVAVARATGAPLAPIVGDRLEAGAAFFGELLDGGAHPRIGDEDEGVVFRTRLAPEDYVRSLRRALLGPVDGALDADGPDLRGVMLGAIGAAGPSSGGRGRCFPAGGYTALRGEDGALLVMDHGPLGYRYTAGHGHDDGLAIWLRLGGRPVLVDAGTYRYNGRPEWRRWMRSAPAHNTIVVDGYERSEPSGAFNWARRARARLVRAAVAAGGGEVEGELLAAPGVTWRRGVALGPRGAAIEDRLAGEGRRRVAIYWHLAPDLRLEPHGAGTWRLLRGAELLATLQIEGPPLTARVERGAEVPGPGAYSPEYNAIVAAECLVLEGGAALPARWVTRVRW